MRLTQILPIALAGALAAPAIAQQTNLEVLRDITEAEIFAADGAEIGEIDDVLVDGSGRPVAVTVEIDDDFLDLDHEERVFLLDQLVWQDGRYVTNLTPAEIETLPEHD